MMSGGLDSILAARIMLEQGIEVTALHFRTGFSYARRNRITGREPAGPSDPQRAAAMLGLELIVIDVSESYLPVVLHPRHGYGSGMNPCVDCRIFLLRQAKAWMEEHDHHFVFTGEVSGQRPKSQRRPTLDIVERESGLEGYLLRPLSAKLLDPTVPERRGWVERDELYAISGRSRKPQMALAEEFGITDYPQPSGGCCYLIDKTYSRRLRDFLEREGKESLTTDLAFLLSIGRQLSLPSGRRVFVGRHEGENDYIKSQSAGNVLLTTIDHPGPMTLMMGEPTEEELELAARITARYSDGRDEPAVRVEVRRHAEPLRVLTVAPMMLEEIHALMV